MAEKQVDGWYYMVAVTKLVNGRSMPGSGRKSFFILSPLPFSVRTGADG